MNTYFERYAYHEKLFSVPPEDSLKISLVIPCYNEPDLLPTLISLNNCRPVDGIEIIIIINEPETCSEDVRQQNRRSLIDINSWKKNTRLNFTLYTYHLIAPDKDAGVGFARKVGMDEAARRFEKINQREGVICCFDADSTCAANYLEKVNQHFFSGKSKPYGAAVYFEHPIPEDNRLKEGIIQYELHLRYYVHALRYIGYPYAHQTVGSSMIVRSDLYQKIGGMNKRKAGEDFYFLHRLMPAGNFIDIKDTVIYPSSRISDRVPFGTGKAMDKWKSEKHKSYLTYNLQSFLDLKTLSIQAEKFFNINAAEYEAITDTISECIKSFLISDGFKQVIIRINKQSSNLPTFINKWYQYFDGFKVLKYLHFARDNYHKNRPVVEEAIKLSKLRWEHDSLKSQSPEKMLAYYREKDKSY